MSWSVAWQRLNKECKDFAVLGSRQIFVENLREVYKIFAWQITASGPG